MAGAARTVSISFLGNTRDLEAALARAGLVAEDSGRKIGESFSAGTDRAAGGLHKLSALGASWGIPFTASLDKIGEKLDAAESKTSKFSTALQEAGKVTLAAGAVGFAGAAAEAVKLGEKFQTATASIQANAGITQKAAQNIGNAFLDTAGKSTFSGQAMASAYAQVAGQLRLTEGAALSTAQATKVMAAATDLAEASQTDLGTATKALAGVMQAYHLGVQQAAGASNVLFNASKATGVGVEALGQAADRLHGRLGVLAPSLTDVTALMVEMAEHGVTGSRGVMQVNTALQTLVGGTAKTDAVLKSLGVTLYNSLGQFVGIQGVIQQMQPKLAGLTQQQQLYTAQTLFGKSAGQAMLGIIQSGVGAYNQATAAVTKQNAVQVAAQAQSHTLHGEMETLKATVQDLGTKFGLFLIPKLQQLGQWLSQGVTWLEKHKTAAIALGAAIAGPLALAVAAFIAGQAAGFIGAIGRMGAGMVGLGTKALTTAGVIRTADTEIVASADTTAAGVDAAIGSTGIGLVLVGVGVAAAELMTHWQTVMDSMKSAVNSMVQAAETALNGLISALRAAVTAYNDTAGRLLGKVGLPGYVGTGGIGSGSSTPSGYFDTANGVAPYKGPSNMPLTSGKGSNASQIAGALLGQGFSKNAVAGILGNFAQETGGGSLASINTRDSGTGASGMGGMGIAQWTAGRRQQEMSYAAIHQESPTSLAAQVGYLVQELRTSYHGAFNAVQGASSPQQAAQIFNKMFEGGTDPNGIRERAAAAAFAQLLGGGSGGRVNASTGAGGNTAIQALLNTTAKGSTAAKAIKSLLYTNPLGGDQYSVERTDQGKDYGGIVGSIKAIGAGQIVLAQTLSGFGQTVVEKLTSGPNKGQEVYYGFETGATGVGIRQGQTVRAGQTIGQGRGTGGVEFGFWNPKTGRSEGAPYFTGSNATPPGTAFASWMAQLAKGSTYTSTSGGITTGGGANFGYTLQQAIQSFVAALDKTTSSLIQTYQSLEQSGTTKTLTKALGVSTAGKTSGALNVAIEGLNPTTIQNALKAGTDPHQLDKVLIPILEKASSKSQATQTFNTLVAELKGSGQTGQANALISARGGVFATLAQEMYAEQVLKDGELLNLQATQNRDMTTLQQNADADSLNVLKATQQKQADALAAQTTHIKDMATFVQDKFSGIVQAIQDATQAMSDSTDAVTIGIQDQTKIQVDTLNLRGKYGLDLVQGKLQVQLDIMKANYDQQIANAKLALDQVTATWHTNENLAQLHLDQVTTQQHDLVAQAQAKADTVTVAQNIKIAAAQARLDALTLHEDTSLVGPAQTAVDLGATLPKAQQDMLNGILKRATGTAGYAEAQAGGTGFYTDASGQVVQGLQGVTDIANSLIGQATGGYIEAQGKAEYLIGQASATLTAVIGQAGVAIGTAGQVVQGLTDAAALAEAPLQGKIDVTGAQASTQFSGGGITINQYGVDLTDPTSMARGMDWVARTMLSPLMN